MNTKFLSIHAGTDTPYTKHTHNTTSNECVLAVVLRNSDNKTGAKHKIQFDAYQRSKHTAERDVEQRTCVTGEHDGRPPNCWNKNDVDELVALHITKTVHLVAEEQQDVDYCKFDLIVVVTAVECKLID